MIILEQWDYKSFKIFFLDFPIFYSKKHKFYIQENIFKKKKNWWQYGFLSNWEIITGNVP